MRPLALALALALALVLLTVGRRAGAQVDDSTRAAARTLGEQALRLEQQGEWARALEKFEQAEALVPVPTLSLHSAMCLERLGRLVEASERYLRAISLPVDTAAPQTYQQAQEAAKLDASRLRNAVSARVAHLHVVVRGELESFAIDDRSYPAALVGTSIPIDPGTHHLSIKSALASSAAEVTLADGEDKTLTVVLEAHRPAPPPAPPPPRVAAARASPLRPIGFAAVGVGAATLLAGVVTYAFALSDASDLEARCPNQTCDVNAHPDLAASVSSYDTMRAASVVLLITGAVLSAVGSALVIASPRRQVTAAIGPLGIAGTF